MNHEFSYYKEPNLIAKSQKLINNCLGYDMKYVESYIYKYFIQPHETFKQWAIRVRVPLQELVFEKKRSIYHVHCLFGAFGNSKIIQKFWRRFRDHQMQSLLGTVYQMITLLMIRNLISQKLKNPETQQQFDLRVAKRIAEYNKYPGQYPLPDRYYNKRIIPYDWIGSIKNQLRDRFQKRLLEIEA
ncbi:hypothetical protein Glove_212g74 [Diversispora epigaea]|uniref:Uncharacterized protein n=1 Tax=Diversispora epigaea TaxID=1348612 RepID=A0A397IRK0_9GLOM|nr:hypothetical protein Glove_212g74 [Diversispora epigaea]